MSRRAAMQYVANRRRLQKLHTESQGVGRASALYTGVTRRGRGAYVGARSDERELKNWDPAPGSPATDTIPDLPTLRARTRDLDRNAPIVTGILESNADHVVGTGLYPVLQPDHEALGITEDAARQFAADATRVYRAVFDTTRLHLSDRMTGLQQQWATLRSVLVGGDTGVVRRFRERPGDLLGLKLEYFEAERISNPTGRADSATLQDGIEFDDDKRPVRMWVSNQHPGEKLFYQVPSWRGLDVYGAETGERQLLHVLEHVRLDQPRGVPHLAPIIKPIKMADELMGNELIASLVQSLFTVFIEQQLGDGEEGEPPIIGPDGGTHYGPDPEAREVRLGKGMVVRLNPGEKITQAASNRPNINIGPFLENVYTMAGAGVGIPFELLTKRFQASYSAARAAMLQAWRAFDRRQTWLVESYMQWVMEWILDEAILRGYLEAPGFHDDPYMRQAWCRAEWRGPTREQLDELKEVLAAERRVEAGFSNIAHEASGLTGLDSDQVHARRKLEVERRVRDGLQASVVAAPTQPTTPTRPRDLARHADPDNGSDSDRETPVRDDSGSEDAVADTLIAEAMADAAA